MKVKKLGPADYQVMPWKNGGGSTTEIWRAPDAARPDEFLWRVSKATVASPGPFSRFPEIDRIIVQLSGGTMKLRHGEGPWCPLALFAPHGFPGDVPTDCLLDGAVATDFNVMIRRSFGVSHVTCHRLADGEKLEVDASPEQLVYCASGRLSLEVAGGERIQLAGEDSVILNSSAEKIAALKIIGEQDGSWLINVVITPDAS